MNKIDNYFDHVFIDNKSDKTLFLLHGTGGSKKDLLFFDELLDKRFNILGLQGNIEEHGMVRFFKRFDTGVFDEESMDVESQKLKKFIDFWVKTHSISLEKVFFLGYSNGANMILVMLFQYPELIKNAVLLHPMLPYRKPFPDLSGHHVFASIGKFDQMISRTESMKLIQTLKKTDAKLTIKEYEYGHQVNKSEIDDVVSFLNSFGL